MSLIIDYFSRRAYPIRQLGNLYFSKSATFAATTAKKGAADEKLDRLEPGRNGGVRMYDGDKVELVLSLLAEGGRRPCAGNRRDLGSIDNRVAQQSPSTFTLLKF